MNWSSVLDLPSSASRPLTFELAARLLPRVVAVSAAVSIALVAYKVWKTPHFAHVSAVTATVHILLAPA
jgi:hypothetical protein